MPTPQEMMREDLEQRYGAIGADPAFSRLYAERGALGTMLAHFHQALNYLFGYMNFKIRSNRHYNADESRELIALIDEIRGAQELTQTLGRPFTVDDYYAEVIEKCREFLRESGGSPIPDDFPPINLAQYRPVFAFSDTHLQVASRESPFELVMVGEGSYARVYRYVDPEYGTQFAIKRARPELDERELVRFRQEFDVLKSLRFPYVLEVYRFEESRHEYSMEFCDSNLRDFVRRYNANLSFARRKRIALQLLYALHYLHTKGHLHRDLSYRNVLLKEYDNGAVSVKLADFGLVKVPDSTMTRTDTDMRGTIIDPALDRFGQFSVVNEIYAIGFMLSYIFTGRESITATSGEQRSIIDRCVAPDPSNRFQSVKGIYEAVETLPDPTARPE